MSGIPMFWAGLLLAYLGVPAIAWIFKKWRTSLTVLIWTTAIGWAMMISAAVFFGYGKSYLSKPVSLIVTIAFAAANAYFIKYQNRKLASQ